jgi:hypothetical protein
VPAKKSRRSAEEVRYLLSGDRKLRRLSLKKISERVKKARRKAKGATGPKAATPDVSESNTTHHQPSSSNAAAIAFGVTGLVLLAALVALWWPAPSTADEQAADQNRSAEVLTADVASAPLVTAKKVAPPAAVPVRAATPTTAPALMSVPAAPAKARAAETAGARAETPSAPASVPAHASAPVVHPAAAVEPVDTVTISGCLEYDGKSAWLKDTSGADAPKTRNWKSGFLRKRSPRIALVDAAGSASSYDGRRVSVTGVLVDREMRVNSLKPAAGDCD